MQVADPIRRRLDNLAEELINDILQCVSSKASLAAVSLTSRKLHRIVEPILYDNISLFVSYDGRPFQVPPDYPNGTFAKLYSVRGKEWNEANRSSLQHDNIRRFRRAIQDRPVLASYVKTLKISRLDRTVTLTGCCNQTRHPLPSPGDSMDQNPVPKLLCRLPSLKSLDTSQYLRCSTQWCPVIYSINPLQYGLDRGPPPDFTWLKDVQIHCGSGHPASDLEPLFRLPNLKDLGLHKTGNFIAFDSSEMASWLSIKNCPIETLSLINCHLFWWHEEGKLASNPYYIFSAVAKRLENLHITSNQPRHAPLILSAFKRRIPQLQTLEISRNLEHPPNNYLKMHYSPVLKAHLSDIWRNQWILSALQDASDLRTLHLDVTDFGTPISLQNLLISQRDTQLPPHAWAYFVRHVLPYISAADGFMQAQLPVSPVMEELVLHFQSTDMQRFGLGLVYALTCLARSMPTAAPQLKRVVIVVEKRVSKRRRNMFQHGKVIWRELGHLLRRVGVELLVTS
ncbi:hypothetical protein E8E13_008615 [Curvularia kusanoi]|uniref:F-box domain-containing protein n=1 Tax=Curvularia kusanoi TaxID=90978 RepID=A0A9P4TFA6_CURKU|nr:hypothetical protein E8E13_008615 [Curvularia kusanoi]